MKKKMISMLLVSAMAVSLFAGCGANKEADNSQGTGTQEESQESQKGDGNSITVLVESGSPAEALANETAADFEKETGCKVVVDAVAYTGMYDKLSTEIMEP